MTRTLAAWTIAALATFVASIVVLVPGLIHQSQRHFARISYLWARLLLILAGARLRIENAPDTNDGETRFYVGNHESSLDIVILIAAFRGNARFLAKKSLFRVPFLGWALSQYGHMPIDRSSSRATYESLGRLLASLRKAPSNLVVFPEGTRSREGRLLPFRKGAMNICVRAGLSVVPFSIVGSGALLKANRYRVHPGPVRLCFADSIPASEVVTMSVDQLHERVRDAVKQGLLPDANRFAPGGDDIG